AVEGPDCNGLDADEFDGPIYRTVSGESALWDTNGLNKLTGPASLAGTTVKVGVIGIRKILLALDNLSIGHPLQATLGASVFDMTAGYDHAVLIDSTPVRPTTGVIGGAGIGDCEFDNQGIRPGRFFALIQNQFVASYSMSPPDPETTKTF